MPRVGRTGFLASGHWGGGLNALACAALLGDSVAADRRGFVVRVDDAEGLDFPPAMALLGAAEHRAAVQGRAASRRWTTAGRSVFTTGDEQVLVGRWGRFLEVVRAVTAGDLEGGVEDLLASVRPCSFDVATIGLLLLLAHGEADRTVFFSHSRWLAERRGSGELWLGRVAMMGRSPRRTPARTCSRGWGGVRPAR